MATFTKDEKTLIVDALKQAIQSAKRQQALKKGQPMIQSVYEKHELELTNLVSKVLDQR